MVLHKECRKKGYVMRKLLLVLGAVLVLGGCQHKSTACNVIRTAGDVCTQIEYLGEDGKVYRVRLDKNTVKALSKASN